MKNLEKKDYLIIAVVLFAMYKLNGISFSIQGKQAAPCNCGGH